jgi:hypothetical protein
LRMYSTWYIEMFVGWVSWGTGAEAWRNRRTHEVLAAKVENQKRIIIGTGLPDIVLAFVEKEVTQGLGLPQKVDVLVLPRDAVVWASGGAVQDHS